MTNGYGEPGSPSPYGEPEEWREYRQPRPMQRPPQHPPAHPAAAYPSEPPPWNETWGPGWGPGDESIPRAGYAGQDEPYPGPPQPDSGRPPQGYPPPQYGYPSHQPPRQPYRPQYPPAAYVGQDRTVPRYDQDRTVPRYDDPYGHRAPYGYADPYPPQRPGYPPVQRPGAPMDDMIADLGQSRRAARTDPEPARRSALKPILLIVVLLVLGVGGYGGYRYYAGHKTPAPVITSSAPAALPAGDPIVAQKTDPKALTAAEVFGRGAIPSAAAGGGYAVVKSQAIEGCSGVATGTIATSLEGLGCTQTVRATLTSPDGNYVITVGIVNLPDQTAATSARASIKTDIAADTGKILGYDAGATTTVITTAPTHVGWDSRGHYLMYAVIAQAGSQPISATDSRTALIVNDLLENYLAGTVVKARESTG